MKNVFKNVNQVLSKLFLRVEGIVEYDTFRQYSFIINWTGNICFRTDTKNLHKDIRSRLLPLRKMEWKQRKWPSFLLLFMGCCILMFAKPTISEQGKKEFFVHVLFLFYLN